MSRAAFEAATPAPPRRAPLTQTQIIRRVLLLAQRSPDECAWHLRPDSPIRAAMNGEIPREAMTAEERRAADIWRGQ
jgi:hypothetical protein